MSYHASSFLRVDLELWLDGIFSPMASMPPRCTLRDVRPAKCTATGQFRFLTPHKHSDGTASVAFCSDETEAGLNGPAYIYELSQKPIMFIMVMHGSTV